MSEFIYTAVILCAFEHEQRVRDAANARIEAHAQPHGSSLSARARTAVQHAAARVIERMWSGRGSARGTIVPPCSAPVTTYAAGPTSSSDK